MTVYGRCFRQPYLSEQRAFCLDLESQTQHLAGAVHERALGDGIIRREADLRPAHDLATIIDRVRLTVQLGIIREVSQVNHPVVTMEECVRGSARGVRNSDDLTFVVYSIR